MATSSVYSRMLEIVAHARNIPISAKMRGTIPKQKTLALLDIIKATLFDHNRTIEVDGTLGRWVNLDEIYKVFSEELT